MVLMVLKNIIFKFRYHNNNAVCFSKQYYVLQLFCYQESWYFALLWSNKIQTNLWNPAKFKKIHKNTVINEILFEEGVLYEELHFLYLLWVFKCKFPCKKLQINFDKYITRYSRDGLGANLVSSCFFFNFGWLYFDNCFRKWIKMFNK